MDKMEITLTLGSPLVSNGGYLTLDALLAALIFEATGDLAQAHSAIPLACTAGVWHGSAAIVEPTDTSRAAFVASLRAAHDLDLDTLARNKAGNAHTRIGTQRRREFGAVMNTYRVLTAPALTWYAEGDAPAVERLLSTLTFIGKRRASGYGQVTGVQVAPGQLNGVTGHFGEPLRPVPLDLFTGDTSAIRADAAWRPAYWHPDNRANCYVPAAAL